MLFTTSYTKLIVLYMKKVYIVTIMLFSVLSCRQTCPCTREYLIANFLNNEKYFSMLIDFYNSHDIVNNKEEQFVFTLNRCKDDVDIDIIPYIIDDKKKQISLSNIRANFERCKNILSIYNINIRKSDIASVINCLKSINCRMVRITNYYSGQIEFIPYQNECKIYHSYIYHKKEISPDIIKFTGKPISSSHLGMHFTLSNESML